MRTDLLCSLSGRSSGIVTSSFAVGTWVCETFSAAFFWVKVVLLSR